MTDEELCKALRKPWFTNGCERYQLDAADRIEALTAKLDDLQDRLDVANKARAHVMKMAVKKQAKLAKAVEVLRFYADENRYGLPSDGPWGLGSTDFGKIARATLAEIEGEKG
jgi:hypothetical protein